MDNFDIDNSDNEDVTELTDFGSDDTSDANISHSPLNLGGGDIAEMPKVEVAAQPTKPVAKKPAEKITPADRITGVKTFFTKLHAGAIEFLDEQITKWLNDNPDIVIKRTNVVTGEIQGKKTEPNIVITVWY